MLFGELLNFLKGTLHSHLNNSYDKMRYVDHSERDWRLTLQREMNYHAVDQKYTLKNEIGGSHSTVEDGWKLMQEIQVGGSHSTGPQSTE